MTNLHLLAKCGLIAGSLILAACSQSGPTETSQPPASTSRSEIASSQSTTARAPNPHSLKRNDAIKMARAVCAKGPKSKNRCGRSATQSLVSAGWKDVVAGNGLSAMTAFGASLELGVERVDAYWGLGVASHIADLPPDVSDICFDRAYLLGPKISGIYGDQAIVMESRGMIDKVISLATHAVSLDADSARAHGTLYRLYNKKGDTAKKKGDTAKAQTHRAAVEAIVAKQRKAK